MSKTSYLTAKIRKCSLFLVILHVNMQMKDYIINEIDVLRLDSSINHVKKLFDKSIFTHFPVVENEHLIGLIIEEDIRNVIEDSKPISSLQYLFEFFYVNETDNWFQVFQKFSATEANILPILNKDKKYIGYFELADILHLLNNTPFLKEEGSVLIISSDTENYSFSKIAQIIESNNATLLGGFISNISNTKTEVTLKISSENINAIIQTFRRYNYKIELGLHDDLYMQELKERSEYLQKYLNI